MSNNVNSGIERHKENGDRSPVAFGLSLAAGILIIIFGGIIP